MDTTNLYLFIHENSKWTIARCAHTIKDGCVCVYTHIPNNTTLFALLNLLSHINFTDMWARALVLKFS